MDYEQEHAVAREAARTAGHLMEEYRSNGLSLERKSTYTDIVTDADTACQDAIINIIQDAFPGDGFLAEENEQTPNGEDRVWVIDPIDGTKNFVHGFPHYAASIALQVDGETVVGAVYSPRFDELFTAVHDNGATLNEEEINVSTVDALQDALVIARLSDRSETIREPEQTFLRELLRTRASFRRTGCVALDLCHVACGRADGHALLTINDWDIAAGALILEEAGGRARIQDAIMSPYREIVASNGELQSVLTKMLDTTLDR